MTYSATIIEENPPSGVGDDHDHDHDHDHWEGGGDGDIRVQTLILEQPEEVQEEGDEDTTQEPPTKRIRREITTRKGSKIVRITDLNDDDNTLSSTRRVGKLIGLQGMSKVRVDPITGNITRPIDKTFFYNSVSAFLASKHFNERRGYILPQLPRLLDGCDFYWSWEYRDGQWGALESVRQLMDSIDSVYYSKLQQTHQTQQPEQSEQIPAADAGEDNRKRGRRRRTEERYLTSFDNLLDAPQQQQSAITSNSSTTPFSISSFSSSSAVTTATPTTTTSSSTAASTSAYSTTSSSSSSATATAVPQQQQPQQEPTQSESERIHSFHADLRNDAQQAYLEPFAVSGAYWSRVSLILSSVTGGLEIPYTTGGSTSAELDGNPYFARTVPTNDADARAAILYYQSIGIRDVACVFIKDSWGINYHSSLNKYGAEFGVSVISFAYDVDAIERTILRVKESGYRYIFAIMHNWRHVMSLAYDHEIVGRPEYVWIAAEEKKWTGDDFRLAKDDDVDAKLAQALHGVGTINLYFPFNHRFDIAMEEMAFNKQLQKEFVDSQANPEIFDGYDFPQYDPTGFSNAIFDSVMAMGIAACNVNAATNHHELFTGPEFYEELLKTRFEGVSGDVHFNPNTGTRDPKGVQYSIEYVLLSDERTNQDSYGFQSSLVTVVNYDELTHYRDFVYNDNTTNIPPALPPIPTQDYNLVPVWAQIFGYVLAAIVMVVSLVWGIWTYRNQKIFVVRASQPFFLCQLCLGTFIMAAAIIPSSFPGASTIHTSSQQYLIMGQKDGDTTGVDIACLSALWMVMIGFCISFTALTSKTWRLNQLMLRGSLMRHSQVKVQHALLPLYVTLTIHICFLLCMTFVSPLQYIRIYEENNVDSFGRSLSSYGTCRPPDHKFWYFLGTLLVCDFLSVLAVTYEAYKARGAPVDFSDADSLSLGLMSMVETLLVGGPLLVEVQDDPTALFLIGSVLLSFCCLTILMLLFVPKYRGRHRTHRVQSVVAAIRGNQSYFTAAANGSGSLKVLASDVSGRQNLVRRDDVSMHSIRIR